MAGEERCLWRCSCRGWCDGGRGELEEGWLCGGGTGKEKLWCGGGRGELQSESCSRSNLGKKQYCHMERYNFIQ